MAEGLGSDETKKPSLNLNVPDSGLLMGYGRRLGGRESSRSLNTMCSYPDSMYSGGYPQGLKELG